MKRAAFLSLLLAGPVLGEAGATLSPDDPRIGVVTFTPGETYDLYIVAGAEHTVLLGADERIQTVLLGDLSAYTVTVSSRADSFSLRQIRPSTNSTLTVRTDKRSYEFMALPAFGGAAPYIVRFIYSELPTSIPAAQTPAFSSQATYRVTGDRDLRPISVRDDEKRTYVLWAPPQAIPAVFAVDRAGNEEIVNGYMRGAEFTIDRVYEKLIFRIDKASATAQRIRMKAR